MNAATRLIELPDLRDRVRVFRDRAHAGRLLSGMLEEYRDSNALVVAVPAGGVPVAVAIGTCLGIAVDVAVVSKITLPWNTEAGYGALAFDGTLRLNDTLLAHAGLDEKEIAEGIEKTRRKIERRVGRMRQGLGPLDIGGRTVILVDDGIASGFTMRVAVEALKHQGAKFVVIAVPTGHVRALTDLAPSVGAVHCANVRTGQSFAVADAYEHWSDVSEEEATGAVRNHVSTQR